MINKRINTILTQKSIDEKVQIFGWVRTKRDTSSFSFLEINDGSTLLNIQIIADQSLENYDSEIRRLSTGCSVHISGALKPSPAKGQEVEVQADAIEVLGWADPKSYPLQKKRHSFEFLREISHLRPRTNALGAVARVRSRLSYSLHHFFQKHQFIQIHTPVITTSDCEGAGEMFQVVTTEENKVCGGTEVPFFGRKAGLTVSGQLQAEIYAQALGNVYTFGPTFRAENSNTSRHLAEFWMIEPEMAFCDLGDNIKVAVEMLKTCIDDLLKTQTEDLQLFDKFIEKGLLNKLRSVVDQEFTHITYSEAVENLLAAGRKFDVQVEWGMDLQSEHERYLTEELFDRPLVVTDYPAAIKPFYMRMNDDKKTVAAMDILVPGIGEIIGGSQREERYDILLSRMRDTGIDENDYQWYLDLRRYGTVVHSGFGLGFERLVQFVTGMKNIRDVIGFPRTPGSAAC